MGGSKGGGQSSSQNQQTSAAQSGTSATQLPPWLTGAAQQAVGTAQTLSQNPSLFNQYGGQQVADVAPGTQASWNAITGTTPQQTAGQIGSSAGDIYSAISGAAMPQQYNAVYGGVNAANSLLGPWSSMGSVSPQQVAQNAQAMMSPYTQAVIDPTLALGQQALTQNLQQIGASANQAGAFGGSRQGVQEGVAQAQTSLGESQQVGNLLNTGYNNALTTAGQLGNTQNQLDFNAANNLATLNANAGAALGGYGQQDINYALSAGQGLPQQQISNLSSMGAQQQSQQQALLNAQMGNYYGAQQQPIQNLDVLLSTLGGVPYGTSTNTSGSNLNFGNTSLAQQNNPLASGMGGAATGAAIGNVIPGVGPLIGAAGGGLLGALGG